MRQTYNYTAMSCIFRRTGARYFLECVEKREIPRTDGREGLKVLKILAACQESLASNSELFTLPPALSPVGRGGISTKRGRNKRGEERDLSRLPEKIP
ncbi:MAG: hypothetical protein KJ935_01665 [Candidatus Omnitrophica bacterium]|nr:hypothetical protein [Candidatus Omnitrophota bacterium]